MNNAYRPTLLNAARRRHRNLVWPLVLIWLLVSNAAWCAMVSHNPVNPPLHPEQPLYSAEHGCSDQGSLCCEAKTEKACCPGSHATPGFAAVNVIALAPPATFDATVTGRLQVIATVPRAVNLLHSSDPPVFLRCCSFLI